MVYMCDDLLGKFWIDLERTFLESLKNNPLDVTSVFPENFQ